jgi:uncharacterized damage-inducible protein DinB
LANEDGVGIVAAMSDMQSIRSLLDYGDKMNRVIFERASALSEDRLAQNLEIGPGSLRRILLHLYNGELVWLARWEGKIETPWPSESLTLTPNEIFEKLKDVTARRGAFVGGCNESKLDLVQNYRDSKGSLFKATLRDMLLQGIVHSIHHRAQAVNAIRRLGGDAPDVDYMYSVRQAV